MNLAGRFELSQERIKERKENNRGRFITPLKTNLYWVKKFVTV